MRPHRRTLIASGFLLSALACSEPEEDAGCPSGAGEFGYAGCALLTGQVYGNLGQPLSDVSVSFRPLRPCTCTGGGGDTDTRGRFSFTVNRLADGEVGDTLSVIVRGVATGGQYPQPTPTTFFSDSVQVLLSFKSVGALPDTTVAEITLSIP